MAVLRQAEDGVVKQKHMSTEIFPIATTLYCAPLRVARHSALSMLLSPTMTDTHSLLEHIDGKILELLEERVQLVSDARDRGEIDADIEAEVLSFWLEEAAERGLNEQGIDKIAKLVMRLGPEEE